MDCRRLLLLLALVLVLVGKARALDIEFTTLAVQRPSSLKLLGRDGGTSAKLGAYSLWLFGDTFTTDGLRSATGALTPLNDPTRLIDLVDESGAPRQLVPFTPDELAYNTRRDGTRIAIWPMTAIATGPDRGVLFFVELIVRGGFDYEMVGTGTAVLRLRETPQGPDVEVQRDSRLLFAAREPLYTPMFVRREHNRRLVYLYAADGHLARVPLRGVRARGRYRYWDGEGWTPDSLRASLVVPGLGIVTWNAGLGKYIAASGGPFFDWRLYVRSAPRPEGPWSQPTVVDVGAPLGGGFYNLHPEFGTEATVLLSYVVFTGPYRSEFHLLRLNLR